MKAVFLDTETLGKGFPLDSLKAPSISWTFYPSTKRDEVVARLASQEIVVTNKVLLRREELSQAPHLKLICVAATGYDNVDVEAAKEFGITVCNVPVYSSPTVIQLTILLMLSLFHSLIPYHEAVKRGEWQKSPFFTFLKYPIVEADGKVLGILGYGQLGRGVASVAESLGMKVLVAARSNENQSASGRTPLNELLPQVDVLSLHLPLNSSTRNVISAKEIALMKPSAFLLNVSRGGLVDEEALALALKEKRLAGAAVDVLSKEPPMPENPLLQPDVPNLIVTPHIGWASVEARKRLLQTISKNILSFKEGKPLNVVH